MHLSNFSSTKFIAVGAFLIFGGLLSISLGIPSATPINGSYPYGNLGYGIWGGLIYAFVGLLNILMAFKRMPGLVMWCMVLNVVCCVIGDLQLALGISAANQDFNAMWLRNLKDDPTQQNLYNEYSDFYKEFFPMTHKVAHSRTLVPHLHNGVVAVDALLAIAGFIVALVAAIGASSLGKYVCCPRITTDFDAVVISGK